MASFDVKSEPNSSIDRNGSNLKSTVGDLDQIKRDDGQDELPIEGEEMASAEGCNSKFAGFALINEGREMCLRDMKLLEEENEELKQSLNEKDAIIIQLQVRHFFLISTHLWRNSNLFYMKNVGLCVFGIAGAR